MKKFNLRLFGFLTAILSPIIGFYLGIATFQNSGIILGILLYGVIFLGLSSIPVNIIVFLNSIKKKKGVFMPIIGLISQAITLILLGPLIFVLLAALATGGRF
jgi:heme/copper-type cytochrome/quinol oxidase subunit 4